MKQYTLVCAYLILNINQVSAADFRNLSFDEPDLSHLTEVHVFPPPRTIQVGTALDLFPGWSLFLDQNPYLGEVVFGVGFRDVPVLNYSGFRVGFAPYFAPLALDGLGGKEYQLSLSQFGMVPPWAAELLIGGNGLVYINGVRLSGRPTDRFGEYAMNVAAFSGQEVKLEIRNYTGNVGTGLLDLDIIGFSVPEPSEWALLILGGGMLWWAGRRVAKGK